jgi:DNA invertase Pin-like site-specific DNA recombinase
MAGLSLVDLIRDEGVSGAKTLDSRPGGKQLVSVVAWKNVQHVVALKLDRLFRDAEDALRQTRAWDKAGVALHLVDLGGQTLNTTTAMGRFFLNMMAAFAELERNMIAERTATALGHKKRHGLVYGPTPFGYTRSDDRLIEHPGEMQVLRQIQQWRTAGRSLRRIAEELNGRRVPTKHAGRKWYASTVRHMLGNNLYPKAA